MKNFNLSDIQLTKYLFFTGKGGVGKTSIACATAVGLADLGKKILLISTDPASNLQDVFGQELNGHGTNISEVPGLTVIKSENSLNAAISTVQDPDSCSSIFRITLSGNFPR